MSGAHCYFVLAPLTDRGLGQRRHFQTSWMSIKIQVDRAVSQFQVLFPPRGLIYV